MSSPSEQPPDLLVIAGIEGAPLRYRGHALAEAHRALGGKAEVIDYRHRDILDAIPARGLVVFYRVPWSTWVRTCLDAARTRAAAVSFSVDDLIFSPELRDQIPAVRALPAIEAEQWMEGVRRYQATAHACGTVIATTPAIAREAEAQGLRSQILNNGLSREVALLSQVALWASRDQRARRRVDGICRVGYLSGTTTHDDDWAVVQPAIVDLLAEHGGLELWLLGAVRTGGALEQHPRVRRLGFRPYQELPRLQTELDIVLAPLEAGLEFSEAKSAIKWMEAAAVGVPTVASPTAPFRAVIADGLTGLLADGHEWREKIGLLVDDDHLRDRIGRAARADVYRSYGPAATAGTWSAMWPWLIGAREAGIRVLAPADITERPSCPALEPEAPDGYIDVTARLAVTMTARLDAGSALEDSLHAVYPGLWRIDVRTLTFGAKAFPDLHLELSTGGRTVAGGRLPSVAVADDGWTSWTFAPVEESAAVDFVLRISQPGALPGTGVAAWTDSAGRLTLRAWSRPDRRQITAVATGRSFRAPDPAEGKPPSRRSVLWHKARYSLASQGTVSTVQRVLRYGLRWWRSRRVHGHSW